MKEDDGRFVTTGSGVVDDSIICLADGGIPITHYIIVVDDPTK